MVSRGPQARHLMCKAIGLFMATTRSVIAGAYGPATRQRRERGDAGDHVRVQPSSGGNVRSARALRHGNVTAAAYPGDAPLHRRRKDLNEKGTQAGGGDSISSAA